jgi:serine/threonine protein kinase
MGRTDKYAAPEQMHGEQVDARTDIYAIGKLMESLPCHHIYNKVIARCTAPSPSDRYQTIEELQTALKPSSHFNLIVMGVLLISMVLLGGYLMTQNHTSGQKDTDHPKKANKNATPTNSSITEKQLTNQKTTFRELTDFEKKEIRNITLSIVQPVYQQTIEPIVDCVIRGDYDSKQSYITKNGELTRFVV